jgi:hypothetical protein
VDVLDRTLRLSHSFLDLQLWPLPSEIIKLSADRQAHRRGFSPMRQRKQGDFDLLCYSVVQFGDSLTFWRHILPLSSGSKSKPSKKPAETSGKLSESRNDHWRYVSPKRRALPELKGVIIQKTVLFIIIT